MGGVDHIGFIKEVSTCKYVLVIYTPNLCSLPGFSTSTPDDTPVHAIQCRRIIPDGEIKGYIESLDDFQTEEERVEMDELAALEDYPGVDGEQTPSKRVVEEGGEAQGYRFPFGYYPGYSMHEGRIFARDLGTEEIEQLAVEMEQLVDILTQQVGLDDAAAAENIDLVRQRLKDAIGGGGLNRQEAIQRAVPVPEMKKKWEKNELPLDHGGGPGEVSKLKNKLNDVLSKDPKVREEQIGKLREEIMAKKRAKADGETDDGKVDKRVA